jgi:polygalacturonase
VLVFPLGIYKTGSLDIPSDVRIYLEAGAILKGVDDISFFDLHDNIKPKSFIRIKDAHNVSISGRGIIDGNGRMLRDRYADSARMRLVLILNSGSVKLEGIIVRDPGSWNTHILNSEDVNIRNVKMLNDIDLSNTDGFDPDASVRVLIDSCFAYCSDDNVAVKTTGSSGYLRDVTDITIRNSIFLTKKSSLKVGTESRGEVMRNITFENNDIVESDRGMALYCSDGALFENIWFINNRFEDNYPDSKRSGMNFTITKRNSDSKPGVMKDIFVWNCSFLHPFPKKSEIYGFDDNHRIKVTFRNLMIGGIRSKNIEEAGVRPNGFTDLYFR